MASFTLTFPVAEQACLHMLLVALSAFSYSCIDGKIVVTTVCNFKSEILQCTYCKSYCRVAPLYFRSSLLANFHAFPLSCIQFSSHLPEGPTCHSTQIISDQGISVTRLVSDKRTRSSTHDSELNFMLSNATGMHDRSKILCRSFWYKFASVVLKLHPCFTQLIWVEVLCQPLLRFDTVTGRYKSPQVPFE